MAQKPVKKTTTKPATKKAAVKKTTVKKVAPAPMMEPMTHECQCGTGCQCGQKCKCGGGCKFGRFLMKLIMILIIFALGFATAKYLVGGCKHMPRGPRVEFTNGCLDMTSVKCPKLLEALPAMDINQDGCITREEYRAVKKEMRREIREMQVEVVE